MHVEYIIIIHVCAMLIMYKCRRIWLDWFISHACMPMCASVVFASPFSCAVYQFRRTANRFSPSLSLFRPCFADCWTTKKLLYSIHSFGICRLFHFLSFFYLLLARIPIVILALFWHFSFCLCQEEAAANKKETFGAIVNNRAMHTTETTTTTTYKIREF